MITKILPYQNETCSFNLTMIVLICYLVIPSKQQKFYKEQSRLL